MSRHKSKIPQSDEKVPQHTAVVFCSGLPGVEFTCPTTAVSTLGVKVSASLHCGLWAATGMGLGRNSLATPVLLFVSVLSAVITATPLITHRHYSGVVLKYRAGATFRVHHTLQNTVSVAQPYGKTRSTNTLKIPVFVH